MSSGFPPDVAECVIDELIGLGYDLRDVVIAGPAGDEQFLREMARAHHSCSSG